MIQKGCIEEKGKWEGGKQWVHLHDCRVKSYATIEDVVLWVGELLTKEDMEDLALAADPNFKPKKGPTVPKQAGTSIAGIWKDP